MAWALSRITPKAVPAAPLGLVARQCHADADVEAAAAIVIPTNIAMRKRLMIALPDLCTRVVDYRLAAQTRRPSFAFSFAALCHVSMMT
jgi:hypothetical protein